MAKIPQSVMEYIEFAFRATFFQDGTEDRVLIYADEQGNYIAARPDMVKRRSSVTGDVPLNYEQDGRLWDLTFDLHSHHEMGCFWSATDDSNERIRGPVFGVFSWSDGPEWKFRRWAGPEKGFIDLPHQEVVVGG